MTDTYWDDTIGKSTTDGSLAGLSTTEMRGSSAETNMDFDFSSIWNNQTGDYPEISSNPE